LSGFGTFAAQALFAQALGRVSNQSVYAAGAVVAIALACVGLGALFTYSLSRRARPLLALGVALAITGGAFLVFPAAFFGATGGLSVLGVNAPWPSYLGLFFALATATVAPVLLPAACVFPSLLAATAVVAARDGRSLAVVTGRLLVWNALGALAGVVIAPWVLIPLLGLWGAIALVGVAYLLGSLGPIARTASPRFAVYTAILGALIFVVVRPGTQPPLRTPKGARVVAIEERAAGLVAVFEGAEGLVLQLDNHSLLGGARDRVRQERQGHLPLLLHPRPARVLFLGSATGSSASAALAHGVDAITLVEIVPGVARAARSWFRAENRGIYDDPRTRVVADDARSFLRASPEKFDVIVGDLFVPWQASTGSLYSVEHFANARARLADGGVFCQWLPLYQLTREEFLLIARSFARAFPAGDVWRGDFYGAHPIVALCGRASDGESDARLALRALPGAADRWVAQAAGVRALHVGRFDPSWLGEGALETEAAPVIEFAAARAHSGRLAAPFTGVAWADFSARIATREEARAGVLLQAASALYGANRREEAAILFSEAARLLPPALIREATPDPSVAEMWHMLSD
jgi:spermidine synthase